MQRVCLAGNVRIPSERANSLQTASMAGAFAGLGCETTLLCARRSPRPQEGIDPLQEYELAARPKLRPLPCIDWIERVPVSAQFLPARVQEFSFARSAARVIAHEFRGAHVIVRDLEIAAFLRSAGHPSLWLELHRLPGGRLRKTLLRRALDTVRGTIAISGGVRDDLVAGGADAQRIIVEHDAYDSRRFADLPETGEARRLLGLDEDRAVVVYTGGLLAWKGVELLVDAARELTDVQFVIAGGMKQDVERLRTHAAGLEHVRIEGFQPPPRVPLYLAAADIGVVPNRSTPAIAARHTSPLKVFEAMAVGLPLVVADLPSMREILSDQEACFFEPDDPAALARALAELLKDAGKRQAFSERMLSRAGGHTYAARAQRLLARFNQDTDSASSLPNGR